MQSLGARVRVSRPPGLVRQLKDSSCLATEPSARERTGLALGGVGEGRARGDGVEQDQRGGIPLTVERLDRHVTHSGGVGVHTVAQPVEHLRRGVGGDLVEQGHDALGDDLGVASLAEAAASPPQLVAQRVGDACVDDGPEARERRPDAAHRHAEVVDALGLPSPDCGLRGDEVALLLDEPVVQQGRGGRHPLVL